MIEHPSLAFAYEVIAYLSEIDDEEQNAKADLLVETFRNHEVSGLTVSNAMTDKRVNISLRADDRKPTITYGETAQFDALSGKPMLGSETVVYAHQSAETLAHRCMDFLVHEKPVWKVGHDEEESE